jgi:hypothetical protein
VPEELRTTVSLESRLESGPGDRIIRKAKKSKTRLRRIPMPSHQKARQLATEFENVYPQTLPERLAWWSRVLGIARPRFLRMMGMSAEEASRQKDKNWEVILEKKEWEENGWWVEGKLHELLALFDYDWRALAERLHQAGPANGEEFNRVPRPKEDMARQPYLPSGDGTEVLLDQLTRAGPESFAALLAYLSGEPSAPKPAS